MVEYGVFAGKKGMHLLDALPYGSIKYFIENGTSGWEQSFPEDGVIRTVTLEESLLLENIDIILTYKDDEIIKYYKNHNKNIIYIGDLLEQDNVIKYRTKKNLFKYRNDKSLTERAFITYKEKYLRSTFFNEKNNMLVQAMKENDDDLVRKMISYNENSNEIYWDEYYENRYGMILVSELLDNISNAAICDMACGHGEQLLNIKQTECYLAGCELDKGRVDWCRNKGLDIHNSDALNTGFKDESFDIVLCEEILEHIKNPKMLINEAKRILKHNGILYLSTPWGDECGSENHVNLFSINDIYSLMIECGFAVENIVTIPYCVKDCYDNSIFVGARNIE